MRFEKDPTMNEIWTKMSAKVECRNGNCLHFRIATECDKQKRQQWKEKKLCVGKWNQNSSNSNNIIGQQQHQQHRFEVHSVNFRHCCRRRRLCGCYCCCCQLKIGVSFSLLLFCSHFISFNSLSFRFVWILMNHITNIFLPNRITLTPILICARAKNQNIIERKRKRKIQWCGKHLCTCGCFSDRYFMNWINENEKELFCVPFGIILSHFFFMSLWNSSIFDLIFFFFFFVPCQRCASAFPPQKNGILNTSLNN